MDNSLTILIPTYNSKNTLPKLIEEIDESLKGVTGLISRYSYVIADDKSCDGTREYLKLLAKERQDVRVFLFDENRGQQENIRRGLKEIRPMTDIVVTMDDDGQHPAQLIPDLLTHLLKEEKSYDLVYAIPVFDQEKDKSREKINTGPGNFRRMGSYCRDFLFKTMFKLPPGLKVSSYRAMTGKLAKRLGDSESRFFYLSAEAFSEPISASNITYTYRPREKGESSYNSLALAKLFFSISYNYLIIGKLKSLKKAER